MFYHHVFFQNQKNTEKIAFLKPLHLGLLKKIEKNYHYFMQFSTLAEICMLNFQHKKFKFQ